MFGITFLLSCDEMYEKKYGGSPEQSVNPSKSATYIAFYNITFIIDNKIV